MASEYIDRQQSMTTRCVFVILLLLTHNVPHKNRSKVVHATEKHISATPFAGNNLFNLKLEILCNALKTLQYCQTTYLSSIGILVLNIWGSLIHIPSPSDGELACTTEPMVWSSMFLSAKFNLEPYIVSIPHVTETC